MGIANDAKCMALLMGEEGFRAHAYDDATGKPVLPGTRVIGHVTVGYGIALDTGSITEPESRVLLNNRIDTVRAALSQHPWFVGLDIVRQHAFIVMAFQLGVPGLLDFHAMIEAIKAYDYYAASVAMLDSKWATQTPARAHRVAAMILNGQYTVP